MMRNYGRWLGLAAGLLCLLSFMPLAFAQNASQIVFYSNRNGKLQIYAMNPDGTGQIQLTNDSSNDFEPVLSPDGTKIAFVSDRDGNSEIYVMNADGTGQTRLTNNTAEDRHPAFSPDGTKIIFDSQRDFGLPTQIYVMNANGSQQTRIPITGTGAPQGGVYPTYSPDGSKILFANFDVYEMSSSGALIRNVTAGRGGYWPRYSPDGASISFSAQRGGNNADIFVISGQAESNLTQANDTQNAVDEQSAWSPDGTRLAFVSTRNNEQEIYVMDAADGGNLTNVSNNGALNGNPNWGGSTAIPAPSPSPSPSVSPSPSPTLPPSAGVIVFSSNAGNGYHLFTMRPDGTGVSPLTFGTSLQEIQPALSPDGNKVAFVQASSTQSEICLINIDGTGFQQLTNAHSKNRQPAWSPDGTHLAFSHLVPTTGGFAINVLNADGTEEQQITNTSGASNDTAPNWNSDGISLLFASAPRGSTANVVNGLYTVNSDGSNRQLLYDSQGLAVNHPRYSPNGTTIVFDQVASAASGAPTQICTIDSTGNSFQQLTDSEGSSFFPTWSIDGSQIACTQNVTGNLQHSGSASDIFVMSATGTAQTNITPNATDQSNTDPSWGVIGAGPTPTGTPGSTPVPTPTGSGNAVRPFNTGDNVLTLEHADDNDIGPIELGFNVNFYGINYHTAFVNNNGCITFGTGMPGFVSGTSLFNATAPVIAGYFADVDTRAIGDVKYATTHVGGHNAFMVTWKDVGYYSSNSDKTNTFQIVIISHPECGPGAFDIEYNYNKIQWETGDINGGNDGLGGVPAVVGFSNKGQNVFTLSGSGIVGAFLDTNLRNGLIHRSQNSLQLGRFRYFARNNSVTIQDDNPPGVSIITPGDEAYVSDLSSIVGEAHDCFSGLDHVSLRVQRLADGAYWNGTTWITSRIDLPTIIDPNTGVWSRPTRMPRASDLAEGSYLLTAIAVSASVPATTSTASITVQVDTTAPVVTILDPSASNAVSQLKQIVAEASDTGSGVASVFAGIQRASDGQWWNGFEWETFPVSFEASQSNGKWVVDHSLPPGSELPPGNYNIKVTALDNTGNVGSQTITIGIDSVAPIGVSITTPIYGFGITDFTKIAGAASDDALGTGIRKVDVSIYRMHDSRYWNGTQWVANAAYVSAVLADVAGNPKAKTWSVTSNFPTGDSLVEGQYRIAAIAYDFALNSKNAFVDIKVDRNNPELVITSPTAGTVANSFPMIGGSAEDSSTGSGIDYVMLTIQRSSDQQWWNSTAKVWQSIATTAAPPGFKANYVPANNLWSSGSLLLPAGNNLDNGVKYTVQATAYDKAGNSSKASVTVTISQTLSVTVSPTLFPDNAPLPAATGTVTRNTPTTNAVVVTLTLSPVTQKKVQLVTPTVTIPIGQTSAKFTLKATPNATGVLFTKIAVQASAPHYGAGSASFTVSDSKAHVAVTVNPTLFKESAGLNAAVGTVTLSARAPTNTVVTLTSSSTEKVRVPGSVTVLTGAITATFPITAIHNLLADGDKLVTITGQAIGFQSGKATVTVQDVEKPTLTLKTDRTAFAESTGDGAATGTVSRNTPIDKAVTVTLLSSAPDRVTVPPSVIIPAGSASAPFAIKAKDDNQVNGSKLVTLTGSSTGYVSGTVNVTIKDDDVPTLSLAFSPASFAENIGTHAPIGTLSINTKLTADLVVTLTSSNTRKITLPQPTVKILKGTTKASVPINVIDDGLVQSTQFVNISAKATGYVSGVAQLTVTEADPPRLSLKITPATVAETAGANAAVGTVTRNTASGDDLTVTLSTSSPKVVVPGTLHILAGATSASFNIGVIDKPGVVDAVTATLTARASGFQVGQATLAVTDQSKPQLTVTANTSSFANTAGSNAATGTVRRSGALTSSLTVNLVSSDTHKATVPATVTIPAGAATANFTIGAVANGPTGQVTITGSATNYLSGQVVLSVTSGGPPPPASTARISYVTVRVAAGSVPTVQLNFTAALDAETASDIFNYVVAINGVPGEIESVSYSAVNRTVTLTLPAGSLKNGDYVTTSWNNIFDTTGKLVKGSVGPVVVR